MTRNVLSDYLAEIARVRATRAGTGEISYYGALTGAFNAIGAELKPHVFCVPNLRNRGAGFPDMGLFAGAQAAAADTWPEGRPPERGVVEVDDIPAPLTKKLASKQVADYLAAYGLVLVTNYRQFELLGRDAAGRREVRERFDFGCADAESFFALAAGARRPAGLATRFAEFLERVLLHQAPLGRPEEVAFFLASYARDALARVEAQATLPAFAELRMALQEALGMTFEGPKGEHLFRSTLVQTLFYGLFSAWVEVAREGGRFDWHAAGWNLHVPFVDTLFQRIATPQQLKPLGLEEPLSWAAAALERVEREAFFARFDEADAVRYFYEPFLAAFDPALRKDMGVWYTPREIVRYMVERVDRVLRDELGLADGLADPSVWVLDPCCGTGAYLVEVLDRIARTLAAKGEGALAAEELKQAAMTRVAGFEIMPAPYVIAHWQVGHMLRAAGAAPFKDDESAAVHLTNALTGWAPTDVAEAPDSAQRGLRVTYPPLADERDKAARVKRERPILVVLGNPPYNAFAGTSPAEESGLVEPYKQGLQKVWGIKKFNLDDLYVRFFRVAERRIAEGTGRGVVCYISNHSWLWYPSYVVMRQRMLAEFDRVWIDNLNGSKFETGKVAPDGSPDPSVFSTEANREGIQVGTAVALLVRRAVPESATVHYRNLWGGAKRQELLADIEAPSLDARYLPAAPSAANRFSLRPGDGSNAYRTWVSLASVPAVKLFNGPVERRGQALISDDPSTIERRMTAYFDSDVGDAEVAALHAALMMTGNRIVGPEARKKLQKEAQFEAGKIKRFPFKPFDVRWCYLANIRPLFSEPSPDLLDQAEISGNQFFVTRDTADKNIEGPPLLLSPLIVDYDFLAGHARISPIWIWSECPSGNKQSPLNRLADCP